MLTLWPQFEARFGSAMDNGYLAHAVRGFFENDGLLCYIVRLGDANAPVGELRRGLAAASLLENVDLICAPDVMRAASMSAEPDLAAVTAMQQDILDHCRNRGDCFAILDGVPSDVEQQRAAISGDNGALYYPWLWSPGRGGPPLYLPPCGHVAGIYSRSDREVGVHKAPANQPIEGVLDLRVNLGEREVGALYQQGVNCMRAFPGRGIRVWGARTLSADPAWRYVNVRRMFLTIGRWIERFMDALIHEPNDIRLWVRIMRDLSAYLESLYHHGALKGRAPDEAFFVKCDSETNTPAVIDAGMVVTEIGVALAAPAEFVAVRIIHGASGVSITTAS
jgi:phage tail sheath protein FI